MIFQNLFNVLLSAEVRWGAGRIIKIVRFCKSSMRSCDELIEVGALELEALIVCGKYNLRKEVLFTVFGNVVGNLLLLCNLYFFDNYVVNFLNAASIHI